MKSLQARLFHWPGHPAVEYEYDESDDILCIFGIFLLFPKIESCLQTMLFHSSGRATEKERVSKRKSERERERDKKES